MTRKLTEDLTKEGGPWERNCVGHEDRTTGEAVENIIQKTGLNVTWLSIGSFGNASGHFAKSNWQHQPAMPDDLTAIRSSSDITAFLAAVRAGVRREVESLAPLQRDKESALKSVTERAKELAAARQASEGSS